MQYLPVPDERFRAEAGILRGLNDPYVVRLYEYVETPQGSAIVMEAIDGVPLRAVLSEYERLEPEAALAVLKGPPPTCTPPRACSSNASPATRRTRGRLDFNE